MAETQHDLVVIGAGPGGYVAAIRAAQLGLNVGCVEREAVLGGTCLRIGCIPSKALLESTERFVEAREQLADHGIQIGEPQVDLGGLMRRKARVVAALTKGVDALFKKNKITRYHGRARFVSSGSLRVESEERSTELSAKRVIVATGSQAASLRNVPFDGGRIGSSTEALGYPETPNHLAVIGAGYIGLELGSVWRRLGSKVTVLEYLDRILPGMDTELAAEARKLFEKQGIEFRLGAKVSGARSDENGCEVTIEGQEPLLCDRVLVAVGRIPNTEGLGLDQAGVEVDKGGRIVVNGKFETTVKGIYAIGDVIAGPMLAHKAEEEGVACVEGIVNGGGHVDYRSIPGIVYTEPEIAMVGQTEDQLRDAGVQYRKGEFPFLANGRARALGRTAGRVKVLADAVTDRILGVHIIGARAGDLIAEAATAMAFGASSEDLARACHAHPTLSEALKEAALAVDGRAIHF